MFKTFFNKYFAGRMSREVKELFWSTAILDFATSAISLFEPIYLYTIGFSIQKIIIFYLAIFAIYFFIAPLGGKIARSHGYEHSILYSTPFLIIYYLSLFAIPYHPFFIISAVIALSLQKMLYWPGFHADFARFGGGTERGKEISNLAVLSSIACVLGPAFGGVILTFLGFKTLFIIVCFLILVSNIPLLTTPEIFEPVPFSYKEAMQKFFDKKSRREFLAYIGVGEEHIALTLWPIFVFIVIKSYESIGFLVSASVFLSTVLTLYVGRLIDYGSKRETLKIGTIFSFFSWILRMFVVSGIGVFAADFIYRTSAKVIGVPFMALTYEEAKKTSVMKSVIFFQMAMSLGRVTVSVLALLLLSFYPNSWAAIFALGGAMTLLYWLL